MVGLGTGAYCFCAQIIDRLPLTIDTLKTSKLGKIVVKLTKDPPAPGEYFLPPAPVTLLLPMSYQTVPVRIIARPEPCACSLSAVVLYTVPLEFKRIKENEVNLTPCACLFVSSLRLRYKNTSAIKDMAQNVERRWRLLLSGDGAAKTPESEGESRHFALPNIEQR